MAHLPLDVIRKELDAEDKLARRKCDETSSELDKVVGASTNMATDFIFVLARIHCSNCHRCVVNTTIAEALGYNYLASR